MMQKRPREHRKTRPCFKAVSSQLSLPSSSNSDQTGTVGANMRWFWLNSKMAGLCALIFLYLALRPSSGSSKDLQPNNLTPSAAVSRIPRVYYWKKNCEMQQMAAERARRFQELLPYSLPWVGRSRRFQEALPKCCSITLYI